MNSKDLSVLFSEKLTVTDLTTPTSETSLQSPSTQTSCHSASSCDNLSELPEMKTLRSLSLTTTGTAAETLVNSEIDGEVGIVNNVKNSGRTDFDHLEFVPTPTQKKFSHINSQSMQLLNTNNAKQNNLPIFSNLKSPSETSQLSVLNSFNISGDTSLSNLMFPNTREFLSTPPGVVSEPLNFGFVLSPSNDTLFGSGLDLGVEGGWGGGGHERRESLALFSELADGSQNVPLIQEEKMGNFDVLSDRGVSPEPFDEDLDFSSPLGKPCGLVRDQRLFGPNSPLTVKAKSRTTTTTLVNSSSNSKITKSTSFHTPTKSGFQNPEVLTAFKGGKLTASFSPEIKSNKHLTFTGKLKAAQHKPTMISRRISSDQIKSSLRTTPTNEIANPFLSKLESNSPTKQPNDKSDAISGGKLSPDRRKSDQRPVLPKSEQTSLNLDRKKSMDKVAKPVFDRSKSADRGINSVSERRKSTAVEHAEPQKSSEIRPGSLARNRRSSSDLAGSRRLSSDVKKPATLSPSKSMESILKTSSGNVTKLKAPTKPNNFFEMKKSSITKPTKPRTTQSNIRIPTASTTAYKPVKPPVASSVLQVSTASDNTVNESYTKSSIPATSRTMLPRPPGTLDKRELSQVEQAEVPKSKFPRTSSGGLVSRLPAAVGGHTALRSTALPSKGGLRTQFSAIPRQK